MDAGISLSTLRKTKGVGTKTIERIIEQYNLDNDLKSYKSLYQPSDTYKIDRDINLWRGDCLELMEHIPDNSVDMILCDLPYGATICSWDTVIPFEQLWAIYKRVIKDNGAIVLFGSEPFSSQLRMSNMDWYKYDWKWDKKSGSNFVTAKLQPLRVYEDVLVFYKKQCVYRPIMTKRDVGKMRVSGKSKLKTNTITGTVNQEGKISSDLRFPTNKLVFDRMGGELNSKHRLHPTQKPTKLLEYLIKTYTFKNDVVLDNAMGSGSTGVACKNTDRKFIGIELDDGYFNIAKKRIEVEED